MRKICLISIILSILLNANVIVAGGPAKVLSPFSLNLSPSSVCQMDDGLMCHDDSTKAVRTLDDRCACVSTKDYISEKEDPNKCEEPQQCANVNASWTKLYGADKRLVGCGCYFTQTGKIAPPGGFVELLSPYSDECKSKEDAVCENPNKAFVRAHDGRCGCLMERTFLPSTIERCELRPLDQVPTNLAFLFHKNQLVGCGYFATKRAANEPEPMESSSWHDNFNPAKWPHIKKLPIGDSTTK